MTRSKRSAVVALLMGVVAGLAISVSLDLVGGAPAAPALSEKELWSRTRKTFCAW